MSCTPAVGRQTLVPPVNKGLIGTKLGSADARAECCGSLGLLTERGSSMKLTSALW